MKKEKTTNINIRCKESDKEKLLKSAKKLKMKSLSGYMMKMALIGVDQTLTNQIVTLEKELGVQTKINELILGVMHNEYKLNKCQIMKMVLKKEEEVKQ